MTDILHTIGQQGLAFVILVGILVALNQGYIVTKNHFDDYRLQRDRFDEELKRELAEKDRELDQWQRISGLQPLERMVEIVKSALRATPDGPRGTP